MQEPSILDECELDEEIKKCLLENIKQKLTQQAVKIRADIEVRQSPTHAYKHTTMIFIHILHVSKQSSEGCVKPQSI